VPNAKPTNPKNKGGRPRKAAELHTGSEAAKRFVAGMKFAIAGGAHPKKD
jgi:hypothetical protein